MSDTDKCPLESKTQDEAREQRLLALLLLCTLAHWGLFLFRVPLLQNLPGWFWPFTDKPIASWWLLVFLGLMPVLGALLWKAPFAPALRIGGVFGIGLVNQFGFAYLEGRGLDGLRDRMVHSGHAEFATIAVQYDESALEVMRHYEQWLQEGKLGTFAHSKPPGQLLLYVVSAKLSNWGQGETSPEEKLNRLRTFASLVWPWLSYLVLLPIGWVAYRLHDSQTAVLACLFYVFTLSVTLATLHADQVFYPLFFSIPLALAMHGFRGNVPWAALLAGVTAYLACYFSFALGLILLFIAGIALMSILETQEARLAKVKAVCLSSALTLCGFLAGWFFFQFTFGYHLVSLYHHATTFHRNWKGWDNRLDTLAYFGFLNSAEYVVWLGLPVALLFGLGCVRSIRRALARRDLDAATLFPLVVVFGFGFLILFGKTKGEVMRLWLFLTPSVVIVAASAQAEVSLLTGAHPYLRRSAGRRRRS